MRVVVERFFSMNSMDEFFAGSVADVAAVGFDVGAEKGDAFVAVL